MNRDDLFLFFSKLHPVAETGCWRWLASRSSSDYGMFKGRTAHRTAYEWFVGPVPAGLELDHICCNRECVNPAHLEPVTRQENTRRYQSSRTHCKRGHALTPDNLMRRSSGRQKWSMVCLACHRIRTQKAYAHRQQVRDQFNARRTA